MVDLELGQIIEQSHLRKSLNEIGKLVANLSGQPFFDRDTVWVWPLAAMRQMPTSILEGLLPNEPSQILVQEALTIDHQIQPVKPDGKLKLRGKLEGKSNPKLRFELFENDVVYTTTKSQLRLVPAASLAGLVPIPEPELNQRDLVGKTETMPVLQDLVNSFVALINDLNPIHQNLDYVRGLGLGGTIIPGTLLAFLLQPACQALLPEPATARRVAIRFVGPVRIGRALNFKVFQKAQDFNRLRILVTGDEAGLCAVADITSHQ